MRAFGEYIARELPRVYDKWLDSLMRQTEEFKAMTEEERKSGIQQMREQMQHDLRPAKGKYWRYHVTWARKAEK